MVIETNTMRKFFEANGLLVTLWVLLMLPAFAQQYWTPSGVSAIKQSAKVWTKNEVANLLAIAVSEAGPTDRKVAALEELAVARERNSTLPDGFDKAIISILTRSEANLRVPAARIVGNLRLESARSELESLATDAFCGDGVAAMKALVSLGGEKSRLFFRKLYLEKCVPRRSYFGSEVIDDTPLERTNIVCALIELDTEIAISDVVAHFSRFPGEELNKYIWDFLFSRSDGSSATIKGLKRRNLPISVASLGIERARAMGHDQQPLIDAIERSASAPANRDKP